ncbi:hypothetical protein FOZ62_013997 [Perkinsus olseni]|uniref:(ABC) transporter n=1 Tax=Perkinsus olseni TaxID=32597 RepID=A0A7J6SGX7_PEROL|nr:hypothetical protein FOZ62_013997 [Perkinsus olseni]
MNEPPVATSCGGDCVHAHGRITGGTTRGSSADSVEQMTAEAEHHSIAGSQLKALLMKNYRVKRRHPAATIMELCCPVFMVLVVAALPLLFGINLSLVTSGEETRLKAELTPE